ncbi:MAG TPA: DUF6011 domain-containing protein [Blastocatellia bacterium]|nr:DUF6011 domain-containing protein [Blastocatellia bacterium]
MNGAPVASAECLICGERLTDPESVKRGTGPVCAAKLSNFLAFAGSSHEEIAALALLDDATVARWLRKVAGALKAGRPADADMFLGAARRAAAAVRSVAADVMAA